MNLSACFLVMKGRVWRCVFDCLFVYVEAQEGYFTKFFLFLMFLNDIASCSSYLTWLGSVWLGRNLNKMTRKD